MQAIRSTRPGGHVGYVGVSHGVALPGEELFFSEVHLHGGPAPVRRFLPDLIDRIWRREIDPGKVFDLTLPLERGRRRLQGHGRAPRHQGPAAARRTRMRLSVLGTGMVGRILAARLAGLGHDVVIGTRDPGTTRARTDPDAMGTPPYAEWQADHPDVRLVAFPDAAEHAEVVLNATHGAVSLDALRAVGAQGLAGKVLLDLGLPLDVSDGMPPTLTVANTDSLGEQVQRAFPETRVVKTLTTVFCEVMVDPARIPGEHSIFVAGR